MYFLNAYIQMPFRIFYFMETINMKPDHSYLGPLCLENRLPKYILSRWVSRWQLSQMPGKLLRIKFLKMNFPVDILDTTINNLMKKTRLIVVDQTATYTFFLSTQRARKSKQIWYFMWIVLFVCLIWFFTSTQQSFSYAGRSSWVEPVLS